MTPSKAVDKTLLAILKETNDMLAFYHRASRILSKVDRKDKQAVLNALVKLDDDKYFDGRTIHSILSDIACGLDTETK